MKQLVISTTSWKALIESLKGNAKHGYNKLESLKQADGYFTAVLCQGFDEFYVARLKTVTGKETDIEDNLDFLAANLVPFSSVQLKPTPEGGEVNKLLEQFMEPEAVVTKIKRTTRGKK